MRPILFEIPGLGVRVYGFGAMMVLALCASLGLARWRAPKVRLDPSLFMDLGIAIILGGVVGARLFFVIQHGEEIRSVADVFKVWQGGSVFYGCILGGAAAFLLLWWYRRFPFRPAIDVLAPSVVIGTAIGRIGCFLNGCCFGDACRLPWAIRFPAESLAWSHQVQIGLIHLRDPHSLPIHPTQLYSVLDGLIVLALLTAYFPIRRKDGEVMALLAVTYPVTRFLIEYLRDDEPVFVAGMTISQNISILIFLIGVVFWYYLHRLPDGRYEDRAGRSEGSMPVASAQSYSRREAALAERRVSFPEPSEFC